MNKTVKSLLLVLCAIVFFAAGIFATLAYLNDTTEEAVNTITVGDIQISLDETDVNEYGEKDSETRVTTNDYLLVPNRQYVKDPTITIKADSEPAYLFVRVQNPITAVEGDRDDGGEYKTIAEQMIDLGWEKVDGTNEDGLWIYKNGEYADPDYVVSTKNAVEEEIKVFENFTVDYNLNTLKADETRADDTVYLNDLETPVKIKVQAYAIQTYGFDAYNEVVDMAKDALYPDVTP